MIDYKNFINAKKREQENKEKWLALCPELKDISGIYILTREEKGIKYAYIGQAQKVLTRLAQHLSGFQHIDISLKKHGLYSSDNKTGWKVGCLPFPIDLLNDREKYYINLYANAGFQLRNKSLGGQLEGKYGLDNGAEPRGYNEGLKNGYTKARKEIAHLFEKNLAVEIQGKTNKNKEKALQKFKDFINI